MRRAALVMAGGRSERMRAGGCKTHKALRTVCGTTLLQHNVQTLFSYGFKDVTIAINHEEDGLLKAAEELQALASKRACGLTTVKEEEPLGTIGAARLLKEATKNLLVINVDNLTDLNLRAFFNSHLQSEAALTVACHEEPFSIPFGQLEVSGSRVSAYREKPTFPIMISSGIYALHHRAMNAIAPEKKTHAPDLINALIQAGEHVATYQHTAWWIDVNDEAALARAHTNLQRKPWGAAASA